MTFQLKNLKAVEKVDCPCGWSRRPFGSHPAYKIASLHATIFTLEKKALPHYHIPVLIKSRIPILDRRATHETYVVTAENTQPRALIYLGKGAIKAEPGTVVYVHPSTIHGGIGTFTPLILGSPGFAKDGTIEIEDKESIKATIRGSRMSMIKPPEYSKGIVLLTAEQPALSFPKHYGKEGRTLLLSQTDKNRVHCTSVPNDRLNRDAFKKSKVTYLTVVKGNGDINIDGQRTPVRELDTLLLEPGTEFSLDKKVSTVIMTIHPKDVKSLVRK